MSRFVEILNAHEREISVDTFKRMLGEMMEKLEAQSGHIEMNFPYFVNKAAPVSKVESLMDYDVTFIGDVDQGKQRFTMKVLVPVTSLCPCSKKISAYGAHNQRSHVTVTAPPATSSGSRTSSMWSRSKRRASFTACSSVRTKKLVTERAYDNPSLSRTWCATSPPC